jgi:hypothetical protein
MRVFRGLKDCRRLRHTVILQKPLPAPNTSCYVVTPRDSSDDVFRRLTQRLELISVRNLPVLGHRSEPALLIVALETKPSIGKVGRDSNSPMPVPSPLGFHPAVQRPTACRNATLRSPALDCAALGGCRQNEPNFPPDSLQGHKRPVLHCAPGERGAPLTSMAARMAPQIAGWRPKICDNY